MNGAVLLDVDGTLLDTAAAYRRAIDMLLAQAGVDADERARIGALPGVQLPALVELCGGGPSVREQFVEVYRTCNHDVRAYAGITTALRELSAMCSLAAVTSKRRVVASEELERAGLLQYLAVIIGDEDVCRSKPDPEPVVAALAAIRIPPERAVMVGDSYVDIEAGRGAGVATVGVMWGAEFPARLMAAGPGVVIERPGQLAMAVRRLLGMSEAVDAGEDISLVSP